MTPWREIAVRRPRSIPVDSPRPRARAALGLLALLLVGCRTRPVLPLMPSVDVDRFMGRWYVIACIPTRIERQAYGEIESYQRAADGRILTTFTYHEGGSDGPLKTYRPVGRVRSGSHGAVWGMRFLWPIQSDYRVIYVDPDYRVTLVGRRRRDFAWIMARTPALDESEIHTLTQRLRATGYDISGLRRVPQRTAG
jgi:apolipoprotein D and lipocalin family protein